MISMEPIEAEVDVYFRLKPAARKFDSPENRKEIVNRVATHGIVLSEVGVMRAIQELVNEGVIERTDGRDEAMDRLAVANAERSRIDQIASAPSTSEEYERFARMSEAEVEQRFRSDELFRARYTKASEVWKFRLPIRPAQIADTSVEPDLGEWKNLDAQTYHSIPTSKTIYLYRNSQQFKKAVDRLISAGKI
jgi:hypothetical protein